MQFKDFNDDDDDDNDDVDDNDDDDEQLGLSAPTRSQRDRPLPQVLRVQPLATQPLAGFISLLRFSSASGGLFVGCRSFSIA